VHVVRVGPEQPALGTRVTGGLGEQFLAWEYAVAVSGRLLGIDPFDQPDVESAKVAARGLLDAQPEPELPVFTDGAVEVFATDGWLAGGGHGDRAATEGGRSSIGKAVGAPRRGRAEPQQARGKASR